MNAGASIDPLDPKGSHVPLFVAAISVGMLQGLLHPLPCYPYAILGPTPEPLSKLEDLILVHFVLCSFYTTKHNFIKIPN